MLPILWLVALLGAGPADLNKAGKSAYARGDFAEAERLFREASVRAPRDPVFQYHRGVALARLGRLGEAAAAYRAALRLDPDPDLRRALVAALGEVDSPRPTSRAARAESAGVPLVPVGGGWVAQVTLNGQREARFLVDTGAAICAITPEVAEELGIEPGPRSRILKLQTAAGITRGPLVTIPALRVGEVEATKVAAVIHELWPGLDGILGNTFLGRYKVTLHPDTRTLALEPRE